MNSAATAFVSTHKSTSRKKWHVLVPCFKHHSIALVLLYNMRLEQNFSIERFPSYTASKIRKIILANTTARYFLEVLSSVWQEWAVLRRGALFMQLQVSREVTPSFKWICAQFFKDESGLNVGRYSQYLWSSLVCELGNLVADLSGLWSPEMRVSLNSKEWESQCCTYAIV